jgi:hypothetical protein
MAAAEGVHEETLGEKRKKGKTEEKGTTGRMFWACTS